MKKIDTSAIEQAVSKFTGSKVSVNLTPEGLTFTIDCEGRRQAAGGWAGGTHIGKIAKGEIFPRMTTGTDPIQGGWYDILEPHGWFTATIANLLKECNSVINPSPPTCVVEGIEIRRDTHVELRREGIDIHRARNDANVYAMSLALDPPNKILAAFREQEEVRQQEKAEDAYWEW